MKSNWIFERSSGYDGYHCQNCDIWIYQHDAAICDCTLEESLQQRPENDHLTTREDADLIIAYLDEELKLQIQNQQDKPELL